MRPELFSSTAIPRRVEATVPKVDDPELLDCRAVCVFFGGDDKPLHPSTIYRLIAKKIIPPPLKVGASSRWLHRECAAALAAMATDRNPA
jgi:predicted DNA-binding transcriptional regulator AlpA